MRRSGPVLLCPCAQGGTAIQVPGRPAQGVEPGGRRQAIDRLGKDHDIQRRIAAQLAQAGRATRRVGRGIGLVECRKDILAPRRFHRRPARKQCAGGLFPRGIAALAQHEPGVKEAALPVHRFIAADGFVEGPRLRRGVDELLQGIVGTVPAGRRRACREHGDGEGQARPASVQAKQQGEAGRQGQGQRTLEKRGEVAPGHQAGATQQFTDALREEAELLQDRQQGFHQRDGERQVSGGRQPARQFGRMAAAPGAVRQDGEDQCHRATEGLRRQRRRRQRREQPAVSRRASPSLREHRHQGQQGRDFQQPQAAPGLRLDQQSGMTERAEHGKVEAGGTRQGEAAQGDALPFARLRRRGEQDADPGQWLQEFAPGPGIEQDVLYARRRTSASQSASISGSRTKAAAAASRANANRLRNPGRR